MAKSKVKEWTAKEIKDDINRSNIKLNHYQFNNDSLFVRLENYNTLLEMYNVNDRAIKEYRIIWDIICLKCQLKVKKLVNDGKE